MFDVLKTICPYIKRQYCKCSTARSNDNHYVEGTLRANMLDVGIVALPPLSIRHLGATRQVNPLSTCPWLSKKIKLNASFHEVKP